MKTIISVTQADIDHGARDNCYSCPIAKALERVLNQKVSRAVYSDSIELWFRGASPLSITRHELPNAARQFIRNFDSSDRDRRNDAVPFTFELDIDPKYLPKEECSPGNAEQQQERSVRREPPVA